MTPTPFTRSARVTRRSRPADEEPSILTALPGWARAVVAAVMAAFLSAALIVAPVVLVWMTSTYSAGSGWQAVQVGLDAWLAAQGVPLTISGTPMTMTPWLLLTVPLVALLWAAQWVLAGLDVAAPPADRRMWAGVRRDVVVIGLAFTAAYAVTTVLFALAGRASWIGASLVGSAAVSVVLSATAYLAGVALMFASDPLEVAPEWVGRWRRRVPLWAQRAGVPALWGFGALAGSGTVLAVLLVVARWSRVSNLYDQLDPGWVGAIVLTVVQALYLPTAAIWGVSWMAGPGFGLGVDSSMTWSRSDPGLVPLIPVIGALPEPGPLPGPLWLFALLPVGAGALIAWRSLGALALLSSWRVKAATTAAGVALTGSALAAAGALTSGSLGVNRLAHLGVPWYFGLAVTLEMAVGAALAVGLSEWRLRRSAVPWRGGSGQEKSQDRA